MSKSFYVIHGFDIDALIKKLSAKRCEVVNWLFDSNMFTESEIRPLLKLLDESNFGAVASWLNAAGYAEKSDLVWEG